MSPNKDVSTQCGAINSLCDEILVSSSRWNVWCMPYAYTAAYVLVFSLFFKQCLFMSERGHSTCWCGNWWDALNMCVCVCVQRRQERGTFHISCSIPPAFSCVMIAFLMLNIPRLSCNLLAGLNWPRRIPGECVGGPPVFEYKNLSLTLFSGVCFFFFTSPITDGNSRVVFS